MSYLNKKIKSTTDRMRMVVSKSLMNLYVQIVDDSKGETLVGISSLSLKKGRANIEVATLLGTEVAKAALKKGVKKVVFDRGSNLYHGRVKAIADSARSAGLDF